MSAEDSHFTDDVTFPFPDTEDILNFDLAFGLTGFDSIQKSIDDPRYGQLKAKYVTWGLKPG